MLNHNDRPQTFQLAMRSSKQPTIDKLSTSYQTVYFEDLSMVLPFNISLSTRINYVSTIKFRR
jgi:hypothetical protein